MRQQLTSAQRLRLPAQFQRVLGRGQRLRHPLLHLAFCLNNDTAEARLGMTVPKRVHKRAHERNRVKRLVRESFRVQSSLPGVDIVIMARQGVTDASNRDISLALEQLWLRLRKRQLNV